MTRMALLLTAAAIAAAIKDTGTVENTQRLYTGMETDIANADGPNEIALGPRATSSAEARRR